MKRLLVLGCGESGYGTAVLAQRCGYDVFVSDGGTILDKYKFGDAVYAGLRSLGIAYEEGVHSVAGSGCWDIIVKSPGISESRAAEILHIAEGSQPFLSEIEFAGRHSRGRTICVTGSNGKTTTVSLIYDILRRAGLDVALCGNIGHSYALEVANGDHDYYVLELSSFQLDGMYRFRADVSVLLNISADHLDRYGDSIRRYAASKLRIVRNQTSEDLFVGWQGLKSYLSGIGCSDLLSCTAGVSSVWYDEQTLLPVSDEERGLQGVHNRLNTCAAVLAVRGLAERFHLNHTLTEQAINEGLRLFKALSHRLEMVGVFGGITFIDDSKATNVDSCRYALLSLRPKIVLILGGIDKGNDYNKIEDLVEERCRALIFMGKDNSKLESFYAAKGLEQKGISLRSTHSMEEAVSAASLLAQAGDTVLLSPCCASFDLFSSYKDRGLQFQQTIHRLCKER